MIMKRNTFLLVLAALVGGLLIGYFIGTHPDITNRSDKTLVSEVESANSPVYDGPFGLRMGLSLDDVKQVCKVAHIEDDAYEITPPKTNDLFESYMVWIDLDYGVYAIRAISENIVTNDHGTELKQRFENIVESIASKYGNYERTDKHTGRGFEDPQYFMYTLRQGSRELSALWSEKHQSKLPDDIVGIAIDIVPENAYSDSGYVILEYWFSNYDAVQAKADSVF
jgi:hypothetical protein